MTNGMFMPRLGYSQDAYGKWHQSWVKNIRLLGDGIKQGLKDIVVCFVYTSTNDK